jgi:hypothetical protein
MDRPRMTLGWRRPPRPVMWLMVAIAALWLGFALAINWLEIGADLFAALIGSSRAVVQGQLWRLVTASMIHSPRDIGGVLFSILLLYFFATPLYERWGSRRLFLFLFGCASLAYAVETVAHLLFPGITAEVWGGAAVMADAALVAWALGARGEVIYLMFVIPLRPMVMVALLAGWHVLLIVARSHNELLAPFVAMLAGWVFSDHSPLRRLYLNIKLKRLQSEVQSLEKQRRRRRDAGPKLRVIPGGSDTDRDSEPPDTSMMH